MCAMKVTVYKLQCQYELETLYDPGPRVLYAYGKRAIDHKLLDKLLLRIPVSQMVDAPVLQPLNPMLYSETDQHQCKCRLNNVTMLSPVVRSSLCSPLVG